MKKHLTALLIIGLAISALTFGILWQRAENSRSDARLLAQAGAADACAQFASYRDTGLESSYWYGVAAFRSFEQAYHLLTEGTNKAVNYIFCNEVYGNLVLSPVVCQARIAELIDVMEILSRDIEDENGYIRMSELRNLLEQAPAA